MIKEQYKNDKTMLELEDKLIAYIVNVNMLKNNKENMT